MTSPLLLNHDIFHTPPNITAIITNKEALAVNQDPLGAMATRIDGSMVLGTSPATQLPRLPPNAKSFVYGEQLAKPLANGEWAVLLLNRRNVTTQIVLNFLNIGDTSTRCFAVRDLWTHGDLGAHQGTWDGGAIPGHGCRFVRLTPYITGANCTLDSGLTTSSVTSRHAHTPLKHDDEMALMMPLLLALAPTASVASPAMLPGSNQGEGRSPPASEDLACVKLAESWCSADPNCRSFGVFHRRIQLHSCTVTMPNSDWTVYAKSTTTKGYARLPGKVDINASACTQKLTGRTGGSCLGPPPPPPDYPNMCGWAPGATPCGPAPVHPYKVLGSVSTGVLEASIFVWHGTEMMLENVYCEDSKPGYPSPDHFGKYDRRFANHSYARIRELKTGRFVANISETIGTSFVSPFVDTGTDTLWLAANNEDRCVHQCGVGVLVLSSKDLNRFTSALAMDIKTCNIDIVRVPSPPPSLPAHRYAMLVEDNTIYLNNQADGNLSHGWFKGGRIDYPGAPGGGPSINYVDGYYYTLTGGNKVYVSRSNDLKTWEGPKEFCRPTADDAKVAPLVNFPAEASARGFGALGANWTEWDWFTGQGWAAAGVDGGTWLMWDASTQGGKSRLPKSFTGSSCRYEYLRRDLAV